MLRMHISCLLIMFAFVECKDIVQLRFVMNKNNSFVEIDKAKSSNDKLADETEYKNNLIEIYKNLEDYKKEFDNVLQKFDNKNFAALHESEYKRKVKNLNLSSYNVRRYKRFHVDLKVFWPNKHNITYSVMKKTIPDRFNSTLIKNETEFAFGVWQKAIAYSTNKNILQFVKVGDDNKEANIKVLFAQGNHSDLFPFDGLGGVLAHSFPPPIGEIHIDADENWLIQNNNDDDDNGVIFLNTLVHEIGHALGLYHSSLEDSVMYPYYQKNDYHTLKTDDVNGLYELYVQNFNKPEEIIVIPDWVYSDLSNSIDAKCDFLPKSVASIRNEYYLFNETHYWRYRDFGFTNLIAIGEIQYGYWPEVCCVVSVTTFENKIVFIDNHLMYSYNTTTLDTVVPLKVKYKILFEDDNIMYGIVDGKYLYSAITNEYLGTINNKFVGITKVDWVIINPNVVSVGVGRGKWLFKLIKNDKIYGNVYHVVGSVMSLMYNC
ncbi:MP-NASE [Choristoneura occidentalis granulovirus]|uniref:MP-NASE n=1 Tax=Choristoneura occidentalis granulovirus TaxID=364745 RepID=Q1A4R3_9BBAC|nr:MP-NASE [Choristoneura fumiferana granulovirus]ABC61167.1 MP-NASE [Choristoneura fumiferana granulovirus]